MEDLKSNGIEMDDTKLQPPVERPPRKLSKPKITLKMPSMPQTFYNTPAGMVTIPLTPATAGLSPNYSLGYVQAYPNKAQEFMFKQFKGFKDFTMNTGKVGLSFGEKFAFWMYGRIRELSRNGFTHVFLFVVMCLFCFAGGAMFYVLENNTSQKAKNESMTMKNESHFDEVIARKEVAMETDGRDFDESSSPAKSHKRSSRKSNSNNATDSDSDTRVQEVKSGYSSSSEESEEVIDKAVVRKRIVSKHGKSAVKSTDKADKSAKSKPTDPGTLVVADKPIDTTDWEVIDRQSESVDTGNESDDFWKSGSQVCLLKAQKVKKPKPKPKSSKFAALRSVRDEWRVFKSENAEECRSIRLLRNECIMQFIIVFIYCGIGAIIFRSTEGAFELFYKCGVKRVKRDFLDTLWSKSHYMREDDWKSLARTKLMEFENQLYDAYEAGMTSYSGQKGWSFMNSLVYCITVVSTIGYGHMVPTTTAGRIMTIVYSLFGIPLFLIMLADYGKLFTRLIKFVWAYVRRLYYTGSCRKVRKTGPVQDMVKGVQLVFDATKLRRPSTINQDSATEPQLTCPTSPTGTPALSSYTIDDKFNLPISVAFTILISYILLGTILFSHKDWTWFESFYFVYISITTIGFGDLVPESEKLIISLVYFTFGLSLTSMCINVVQEKLSDSFKQATAKLGATMGFEVSDENNIYNFPAMTQNSEQTQESQ